jgi:hypothetical protein
MGEYRAPATAARLKRMGTTSGWPDFILLGPSGLAHFLEIKRRSGRLSEEQQAFSAWCVAHGIPFAIVRSFDEALRVLRAWGAIHKNIEISA